MLRSYFNNNLQAHRISQEFTNQYNSEVENGLEPTAMWAHVDTDVGICKSQVGFIQIIVAPMWTVIMDFFPEFNTEGQLIDVLNSNKEKWQAKLSDCVVAEEQKAK